MPAGDCVLCQSGRQNDRLEGYREKSRLRPSRSDDCGKEDDHDHDGNRQMKTKILFLPWLALAASISFSACADEHEHHHDHDSHVSTTTTEETNIQRPVSATTETQTIRSN